MSQSHPPTSGAELPFDADAVDRYLDGAMSESERTAFDAQIAQSEMLRGEIALQNQLDSSLRAGFGAPPVAPVAGILTREEAQAFAPKRKRAGWSKEYKMFGALAALLAIAISIQGYLWLTGPAAVEERPSLAEAYYKLVNHKFRPSEECTTREKFAQWMSNRFGVALAPKEERADVQFVGWSYSGAISNYTGLLLAKVDGKPVVVAIDTVARQNDWGIPCRRQPNDEQGVNFFSAEIDGIALYEITPLDHPRIVDNLAVFKPAN
ncbi:MAG: anti-sigma factor family protein [Phycisphaerales bacterium]